MIGTRVTVALLGAGMILGGSVGTASAGTASSGAIPRLHIKGHLRADGPSDLRGKVRARSGLTVTDGLTTDSLTASGPVQVGGTLTVVGAATTGGLNAGAGGVVTTGSLQGGTLTVAGDATVGGNITAAKTVSAAAAQINGALAAGSGAITGTLSAGSISTSGSLSAGSISGTSGAFQQLSVAAGGSVNFNNATVTGLSGLNLSGTALTLQSLAVSTSSQGGIGGTQALVLTQGGQSVSLSVSPSDSLTVSGGGMTTSSLTVTNAATVNGQLNVSTLNSTSGITLTAPSIALAGATRVTAGNDLQLGATTSSTAHLVGNRDTEGTCTANATAGTTNSCNMFFARPYGSPPVVVVTPAGSNPNVVTGYSVQTVTGGFTIFFTTSGGGSVTFNYIVEG